MNLLAEFHNLKFEISKFIGNTGVYLQIYVTSHSSRPHNLSFSSVLGFVSPSMFHFSALEHTWFYEIYNWGLLIKHINT